MASRIYVVTRERYHVRAAKTDDVVMHMSDGGKVEDATKFDAGEAAK